MKISPLIRAFVVVVFVLNTAGPLPARAQDLVLPRPGAMVSLSPAYNPPVLKGIKVYPDDAFRFDFIMDKGDGSAAQWKPEASKLIKYFLAGLTVPEKDLWVNLSPYEKNRIVPESFGRTAMGRDLLAEDYLLKQITASLIYPEGETGRKFWKRVYEVAAQKFHTTDIPVNTFNKVWIMPETAVVYENTKAGTAYVVEAKLKVMLEQDYLALSHHVSNAASTSSIGAQVLRAIVIPELTREVNDDKNFAALRQVYNSLILATWYKKKIKNSILEAVYADKNKVGGVGYGSGIDVESIYQRYLRAFKKGVYNYVKEETDPLTQETVPRKYFSGGETFIGVGSVIKTVDRLPAKDALADQAMIVRASFQSLPASQPEEELAGGIGDLMDNVVTPDGRPLTPISSGIAQDPDRLAAALIEKLNGVVLDKQRTAWALLHVTQKPFNGHVNGSPEIVIRFGPRETFYMTFVLNKNKITRVSVFAPKFGKLLYAVVGSVLPSGIQAEGDITEEKSAQELQQEYEVRGTDVYENGRLGRRVVDGPSQDHSIGMADVLAGTLIGTLNMKYMGLSYRDFIYDGEHGVRALWAYLSKGHNEDAFTLRFRKDAAQVALLESDFGRRMYFDPRHRSLLIDNKAAELIGVGGSNYIFNTFNHVAFRIYYNPHALPPGVRGGFETMANSSRGLKILGEGFTANGYYFLAVEQVQGDSLDHMADLNPKQWRDFKAMWRDLIDKMYFMDDPKPQQFMYGFTQRVRRDQWWVVDAELV
ncbi:MAG: hypothetical protein KGJ11_05165, partial [Candidatus Omnitrophica bacterium]|nr:hypothetical protein [Candidatus Omnitrophota bacterium]